MTSLSVSILPTFSAHVGMSMRLYNEELLGSLCGFPELRARLAWPPFAAAAPSGWFADHWTRYVGYLRWCRKLSGDLFHIADHANAQLLLALPAARTVVTCHDLYPVAVALGKVKFQGTERPYSMFPTALRVSLLRKAAAVVAISRHTLEECRSYFGIPSRRLSIGYHGISERFRSPGDEQMLETFRRRHAIDPSGLNVLHVGSNNPRKNLTTVFRVVAALRQRHGKNASLVKVGEQFSPREMKTIRELGLQEVVRDLGSLSDQETVQAYRASTVLLYPSFHEGMCRPAAEAMACGTPVVASRCGAIPEVVQDARLLFDPEDAEAMALRILQIVESNDLRQEVVERGRQAVSKFTWEAHGAAVAEAYKSITQRWV